MQQIKGLRANKLLKELQKVRAGFITQGTSLSEFCDANGIDRRNASRAFKRHINGEVAKALRQRLIEASKGKVTQ